MTPSQLIVFSQKAIDAGKGDYPIIVSTPNDDELEITDAIFYAHGVDTYEATDDNLVLKTNYRC